jgi:acyl carrier protein
VWDGDGVLDAEPLRDFIRKEFLFGGDAALGRDDPLFPDVVDSLGVMTLIDFVEEQYDIRIEDEELLVENFSTLGSILELIDRKRA